MDTSINAALSGGDKELALPEGSLILVTGASSYIGSHVVNEALKANYKVRGTARSQKKCDGTKALFGHHPNYSTIIVANFQDDLAFDQAMGGCDAVIHVASDTTFDSDPAKVITPVLAGMKSILRSASKNLSVKRFVLTSSSCAVLLPKLDTFFTLDKNVWNLECIKDAWAPPPYTPERATAVYSASKTEAEQALWKFVRNEKPHFVVNAILPNVNMGRVLSSTGATGGAIPQVFKGEIPLNCGPQYMIDVIDDARLHLIAAVMDASLKNERIFAFNVAYNWTDIVDAIKQVHPDATTVATPPQDESRDLSKVSNEQGADLLRKWYGQESGYKPLIQSVRENLEGYI